MGRSDYLVQAGVGFDIDRSGARKSIGIFETLAGHLQKVATKTAADGFAETQKEYEDTIKDIKKTDKEAAKALEDGVKASAEATQKALQRSMMKPEKDASARAKAKVAADGKKYSDEFDATMKAMEKSYSKFQKQAAKLGIDVKETAGFGKGGSVKDFADKDIEQRKQLINLTKRMVKDEKKRLSQIKKGTKAYDTLEKEIKALEEQEKAMVNLNEDLFQQEKKYQKVKQKGARDERKAEKKRAKAQKAEIQRLKTMAQGFQRVGQVASMTAGKIKSGLQNAFVIGTAAATAFFYKMQPLAESVMAFEKTIINANSVFNVTQKELHSVSDEMVKFTMKYGVSAQETATGLYQLASAGLSAADSQEVLQHTMKLAMATQGDHNTLAKLTVQTIAGFGFEMEYAGELTDKFAHSIQKSLIEWEDLASSVKFAMPFFVATGQSIDQLLGGLEVLTNRALEAGIAGRGLRQALAQFAKHASNNESAFAKMGISIMNAEGDMRDLTDIASEAKAAFGDVSDLEALTAMLEDMNVRGATAFALLVQNADEFQDAVVNLQDAAGEATQMADIQQQSLEMQIQRVKNALLAPFLLSDEIGQAGGSLNAFTLRIKELVDEFTKFFIVIGEDGKETYSEHGQALKEFVIDVLDEAVIVIRMLKDVFLDQNEGFSTFTTLLKIATFPLKTILKILDYLGPNVLKIVTLWKLFASVLPITNILTMIQTIAQTRLMMAIAETNEEKMKEMSIYQVMFGKQIGKIANNTMEAISQKGLTKAVWDYVMATKMADLGAKGMFATMLAGLGVFMLAIQFTGMLGDALAALAGVFVLVAVFNMFQETIKKFGKALGPLAIPVAIAAAAMTLGGAVLLKRAVTGEFAGASKGGGAGGAMPALKFNAERNYDGGGTYLPVMDNGGLTTEHGAAILQKGETVIPKTQNMLGGGITLNMGDVNVQDGEDFAERVAAALPGALQRVNDQGAI